MTPTPSGRSEIPATVSPSGTPSVEVESLRALLERGADLTVLDIRPRMERDEWFIPGSIHDDAYQDLKAGDPSALAGVALPTQTPVVVVCARGNTSQIGTRVLRARGVEAYSLMGGMKAWSLAWNTAEVASPNATLVQVRRTGKG